MKKSLFGYNVSEVDVVIGALREENESLNATITTLQTQLKNNVTSNGAKANLLEADLKKTEEDLKKISEENKVLLSQISLLTMESGNISQQKEELIAQTEHLHRRNEDLTLLNSEFQKQIIELTAQDDNTDRSVAETLKSQLESEKEYKTALEQALKENKEELAVTKSDFEAVTSVLDNTNALMNQKMLEADQAHAELAALRIELEKALILNSEQADQLAVLGNYAEDYNNVKEKLVSTYVSLNEKAIELEKAQKEIKQFKNELAVARSAAAEQANKKKQPVNLNQASEISFQAYYDMSRMRNEVVEYMHEQMKEYYQLVNDNSIKMRNALEQRQSEYNQMIREFFTKTSEFRVSLSNIEDEYNTMVDYSMNTDKITSRMNEIMDNFIRESNLYLKNKEVSMNAEEQYPEDKKPDDFSEEVVKKPIVFKISG